MGVRSRIEWQRARREGALGIDARDTLVRRRC
jgi:hypothetical protein